MKNNDVVIVAAGRTPIGEYEGAFKDIPATHVGGGAIEGVLKQIKLPANLVNRVIAGMVIQGGAGQSPVKQAMKVAGLPWNIPGITINGVCGSSMYALILAADQIRFKGEDVVIAMGMENMYQVPYYDFSARGGNRMGDNKGFKDGMIFDGLRDPYGDMHMGNIGEICVENFKISKEAQDAYAMESYQRAIAARDAGKFKSEIIPVETPKGIIVTEDEELKHFVSGGKFDSEKALKMSPAFKKPGTITAFNASKISHGAAALVLMSAKKAKEMGIKPLAIVHGSGECYQEPNWFTTAPAPAIKQAVANTSKSDGKTLTLKEVDLFEINEAFSVVPLANMPDLGINRNQLNVHGGAVALGHPIGASGVRIVVTGLYAMIDRQVNWLAAGICLGGGGAVAIVIERVA
jgi:acetyl-CoA C-acetyltransferase